MARLFASSVLPQTVEAPEYDPEACHVGIVHFGVGAFHRAHQAVYTDTALASDGGDWRILGVSLRSPGAAEALNAQNGRYCLIERAPAGPKARIIGAVKGVLFAPRQGDELLAALAAENTRIVSLTVTEKGYNRDALTGGLDKSDPSIAADLAASESYPTSAIGWIVKGLQARYNSGTAPFTVLSCDNLPDNGDIVRRLVLEFAALTDSRLHDWIMEHVTFPSTMVDRITPAPTEETLDLARKLCGNDDLAAVETESFSQWVLEDRFCNGRPQWQAGGALFVSDIAAYETMKLRMLNGTHSMLAYAGLLARKAYVRDVMADPILRQAVMRHLEAAAGTVPPVPGIDLASYGDQLCARFENRNIAHATLQIAMDGSQKLPQRIFAPAMEIKDQGLAALEPFAFATACWIAFVVHNAETFVDPRAAEIRTALRGTSEPDKIVEGLTSLPGLMPPALAANRAWQGAVRGFLERILKRGVMATLTERFA